MLLHFFGLSNRNDNDAFGFNCTSIFYPVKSLPHTLTDTLTTLFVLLVSLHSPSHLPTYPLTYFLQYKLIALFALLTASASAFTAPTMPSVVTATTSSSSLFSEEPKIGAGGMADTRDPEAYQDEDPRKSISEAPSFEEYLKQREAGGN